MWKKNLQDIRNLLHRLSQMLWPPSSWTLTHSTFDGNMDFFILRPLWIKSCIRIILAEMNVYFCINNHLSYKWYRYRYRWIFHQRVELLGHRVYSCLHFVDIGQYIFKVIVQFIISLSVSKYSSCSIYLATFDIISIIFYVLEVALKIVSN